MIELRAHFCLEKAAGLCSEYLLTQLLPHFSLTGVLLPCLAVKLLSSGQPYVRAMDQSSRSVPMPDQAPADSPPTWLSPLSLTPEERSALLRVAMGWCRDSRSDSRSSTPAQIDDTLVIFARSMRPHNII